MTVNPETEVVASSWDRAARTHSYTIERHGKRWTVAIPDEELVQFGRTTGAHANMNKTRRRAYLAGKLEQAMQGEPDA